MYDQIGHANATFDGQVEMVSCPPSALSIGLGLAITALIIGAVVLYFVKVYHLHGHTPRNHIYRVAAKLKARGRDCDYGADVSIFEPIAAPLMNDQIV